MNAAIVLDQPGNVSFTNLDEISGRVVVRATRSIDVDAIVVKLEGESRTRLMSPGGGPNNERPKAMLEYHKILYRVQPVFPPRGLTEGRSGLAGKSTYTLPAGQHEYPFRFKIPFNNACATDRSPMPTIIGMSTLSGLELAKPATRHVKKTLPPTLSGFPGEAEIRYFVKATVSRHSVFKENPRAYAPFNFFPIEPPRPPVTGSEVYARQRHAFDQFPDGGNQTKGKGKMKAIFGDRKDAAASSPTSADAPHVSVDVRLPEPAIITCNADLPLRMVVKKLSESICTVRLQSLQVSLLANTKIRAHNVVRTEQSSWIIMSKSNMAITLGSPSDPVNTETVLDERMWRQQVLPNAVAPSFETCNIQRSYQLDVRIGLSYASDQPHGLKQQSIVLPLRLDVQVYSGISPPAALLEAMAQQHAAINRKPSVAHNNTAQPLSEKLQLESQPPSSYPPGSLQPMDTTNAIPPTPTDTPPSTPWPATAQQQQPGSSSELPPMYSEAPPSYEDAIATHLPPVSAQQRPQYVPPPTVEDDLLGQDEKKGWRDV